MSSPLGVGRKLRGNALIALVSALPMSAWHPSTALADSVTIPPGESIQAAIDASPPATTFILPAGVWHRQKIIPKMNDQFIGEPNGRTILSGDDEMATLYSGDGSVTLRVVFKNISVEHYGINKAGCYLGAIHGAAGWIFDHTNFVFNNCSGVNLASGSSIIGGRITDNAHGGIKGGKGVTVRGAEIARNNTRGDDIFNDAAGVKLAGGVTNSQLINNWVHDNYATGLWCDISCDGVIFEGNTVLHNGFAGIMYEISSKGIIRNNVVNDNISIQIFVSSSDGAEVYGNNVRVPIGNAHGILIQADRRPDAPITSGNAIRSNTVTFVGDSVKGSGTGFRIYGGLVGKGNYSDHNAFYTQDLAHLHWFWSNPRPLPWDVYRLRSGQDANSTLTVGDGSLRGCPREDCESSGTGVP
jgi:parallel beta-helix repeat protein